MGPKTRRIQELERELAESGAMLAAHRRPTARLLILGAQRGERLTELFDMKVEDFRIQTARDMVPFAFSDANKVYLPTGGTITIEWH